MPDVFQIPLLASSAARCFRVTNYQPPAFAPGGGPSNPNRQTTPAGPAGWYLPGYDDSAWVPLVLADTPTNLPETTANIPSAGGVIPFPGDPVWITATESDPDAVLLVRWWVTAPATAPTSSTLLINRANGMLGEFQAGANGAIGFLSPNDLTPGALNLVVFAVPMFYRGELGTTRRTAGQPCWFKTSLVFVNPSVVAPYCHVPLLVTSNVKMLRVTTAPTPPLTITTAEGIKTNPDSLGPVGWHLIGFDDSAWTTPVLVNPVSQPAVFPLHYSSGTPDGLPVQGDPLWTIATELNPAAVVLIRWKFNLPPSPQGSPVLGFDSYVFHNEGLGMKIPTLGYLNVISTASALLLGNGLASGAGGIGRAYRFTENLLAVAYGVYPNTRSGAESFVMLDIVFPCSDVPPLEPGLTHGRSYAQVIG